MSLIRYLIRTFLVLIIAVIGTAATFTAPGDWLRVDYPVAAQQPITQTSNLAFTARAPPIISANVTSTGTVFAQIGNLRAIDGAEATVAVYVLSRSTIATNRTQLIGDLVAGGTRITPENVVDIRIINGRTVWLETGNSNAGLRHIVGEHGSEFAQRGIPEAEIPDVIFTALQRNNM